MGIKLIHKSDGKWWWINRYDDRCDYTDITIWCINNCGKRDKDWYKGMVGWAFRTKEDAILFQLTWG